MFGRSSRSGERPGTSSHQECRAQAPAIEPRSGWLQDRDPGGADRPTLHRLGFKLDRIVNLALGKSNPRRVELGEPVEESLRRRPRLVHADAVPGPSALRGASLSSHGSASIRRTARRPKWRAGASTFEEPDDLWHDTALDAEVAEVVDDHEVGAGHDLGGVPCVDHLGHAIATTVQDRDPGIRWCRSRSQPNLARRRCGRRRSRRVRREHCRKPAIASAIHAGSRNISTSEGASAAFMLPSSILVPFSPWASVAATIAASRSSASHTARACRRLMVARAGCQDMSVIEQHATTPSTRAGGQPSVAFRVFDRVSVATRRS
jgi:hypothetical protein